MYSKADITSHGDTLHVSGVIDFSNANIIWEQSLPLLSSKSRFDIDFSKIESANSAALALLIEWIKYAKREKKPIQFHYLPKNLVSVASVAGLDQFLS